MRLTLLLLFFLYSDVANGRCVKVLVGSLHSCSRQKINSTGNANVFGRIESTALKPTPYLVSRHRKSEMSHAKREALIVYMLGYTAMRFQRLYPGFSTQWHWMQRYTLSSDTKCAQSWTCFQIVIGTTQQRDFNGYTHFVGEDQHKFG